MQRRTFHSGPAKLTAVLCIDGLAVCYFNKTDNGRKLWEVAFLREQKHDFKILVTQESQDDGQVVGEVTTYNVPQAVRRLELVAENGSDAHYQQFPEGYFGTQVNFPRTVGDDLNDFGWVIDFVGGEVPHGKFKKLMAPDSFDVVLLKVPFSLFYTEKVTDSPMLLLESNEMNKDESTVFGHTNEIVGAHVLANPPSHAVLMGTDLAGNPIAPFPIPLPRQEGLIHRITFKNMERKRYNLISEMKTKNADDKKKPKLKQYEKGDFILFYKVIELEPSKQYNLHGPVPEATMKGKMGDCNVVRVSGTGTLERLLD